MSFTEVKQARLVSQVKVRDLKMAGKTPQTLTLKVTGMTCGNCDRLIKDDLARMAGVVGVEVRRTDNRVDVNVVSEGAAEEKVQEMVRRVEALAGGNKFKAKLVFKKEKREKAGKGIGGVANKGQFSNVIR